MRIIRRYGHAFMSAPRLNAPPINEVVCGFILQSMPELTPQVHGTYWERRRDTFPKCEAQPIIVDEPVPPVFIGSGFTCRTWLLGTDETRLVQLQHDRFYVNWRRRNEEDEYPRFSPGQGRKSLLPFALEEYGHFSEFCKAFLAMEPRLMAAELTKIDILRQGVHWSDAADLGKLVPATAPILGSVSGDDRELAMRVSGVGVSSMPLSVNMATGKEIATQKTVLRIETRGRKQIQDLHALEADFKALNEELNETFFSLLARNELHRFSVEVAK